MKHLEEAVKSIEQQAGWDSPPQLFALVETKELLRLQPDLAASLGLSDTDVLTAVDQGELPEGDLSETLSGIVWPDSVHGCALSIVRVTLPPEVEDQIPAEGDAVAWASNHPLHEELKIVVGVLRDGSRHSVIRIRRHEDDLLSSEDLVPDLSEALSQTLVPDE